ncbi:MAG: hypothetical protein IJ934_03830 [Acetobacter sp.]|nr:hypothetical protein [Acetobacter sp.]
MNFSTHHHIPHGYAMGHHHAFGHAIGYSHAAHSFLGSVAHSMFNGLVYATVFRIAHHLSLPILIGVLLIVIYFGWRYARTTGQRPW